MSLDAKPRDYAPNSGPPLQRITLLPPQDSTAYIIERILLPPNEIAHDGKPRPKRMTYIVGWRDLPAATLLVPAMDILEYVSPRELENWETALEQELSEDRAKLEEAKKKKISQPAAAAAAGEKTKKKRGRPPAHAQIESAVAAELETDEDASKNRLMGGALGLSTPQKKRLKDFRGLSGDEGSPSRQLERERYENTGTYGGEEEEEAEEEDFEMVEFNEDVDQAMELDSSPVKEELMPSYVKSNNVGSLPLALQQRDLSVDELSSIDMPSAMPSTTSSWVAARSSGKQPQRHSPQPKPYAISFTPAGMAAARHSHGLGSEGVMDPLSSASPGSTPNISNTSRTQSPRATSAAKQKRPKPKKPPKPTRPSQPVQVGGEEQWVVQRLEDDALYEVEGKGFVRYFKVRWEGDWPPEQNPSWEPEENIPPNMVRNYFKRGKDRRRKPPSPQKEKQLKQTKLSWTNGRKYSSVSEAFAGDEDESFVSLQGGQNEGLGDDIQGDEGDDDEELFVVDETHNAGAPSRPAWNGHRASLSGVFGGV